MNSCEDGAKGTVSFGAHASGVGRASKSGGFDEVRLIASRVVEDTREWSAAMPYAFSQTLSVSE